MENYKELELIIETSSIRTFFQPIIDIKNATILGYEALSRGPIGSPLEMPEDLFETARKNHMLWELEALCRSTAIQNASLKNLQKNLFINVDPRILKDSKFKEGFTIEKIKAANLDPNKIIFEITEKSSIEDYTQFREATNHYTRQGFKIAIDDTGAGYSGMRLITETKPNFIKLDMELIRNIDKDSFKQALCKNFLNLSNITNMKLIAEGVETKDELNTLINIGVEYVQGFYLARPSEILITIPDNLCEEIVNATTEKSKFIFYTSKTFPIGKISRLDKPISLNLRGIDVKNHFENTLVQGITIVKETEPIGIIMKNRFNEMLASTYGNAVYLNRSVELLVNKTPLIVDFDVPISEVSKLAMSRTEDTLYDYIIITQNGHYHGIVTVKRLLEYSTELELNYARHLNPLTGIPGNITIEAKLNEVILNDLSIAVLYLDLDNFKAYNDIYGFENGDKIIKLTADIIKDYTYKHFGLNPFIGHIGGDDFIIVVENDTNKVINLCNDILNAFDKAIGGFYNLEHMQKGYIVSNDRYGNNRKFNIMSLSIAVLAGNGSGLVTPFHAGKLAATLKSECKKISGSNFLMNSINSYFNKVN